MPIRDFLYTQMGKRYLLEEYVQKERSTHDIARERGTYPNKVRRALIAHGIELRTRGRAQERALDSGRHPHPTRGKARTAEERGRIGEGVSRAWKAAPPEELERRRAGAKARWEARPEEERKRILELAGKAFRRAAAEGSGLERHLLSGLRAAGYEAFRRVRLAEGVGVDLLLARPRVAIEVNGPTHYLPVFGEEALGEVARRDGLKAGAILSMGYLLIRVKSLPKKLSGRQKREALSGLLAIVRAAEAEFPPPDKRLLELEVSV